MKSPERFEPLRQADVVLVEELNALDRHEFSWRLILAGFPVRKGSVDAGRRRA
jgi:hypothetical protein